MLTQLSKEEYDLSEVREYEIGDDLRTIDWNVTARYNSPFVKVFEEERERNYFNACSRC